MRAAAALLLALAAGPAEARTWIAAVGSDRGLPSEVPLRFAEADARALLATLAAVHPDPERSTELIAGATPAKLRALLDRWEADSRDDDTLLLFLTGHGDRRGAHLGGDIVPWAELDARMSRIRARVVVLVVDTCQSGALLGPKGFVRAPPVTVRIEPRGPRGRYYLTSSGADEVSHESARVGGSPFVHHLISGLRGAADADADGAITVSELYRHVFARTVASTIDAPLGPQRPEQAVALTGAGEVVLGRRAGASLRGSAARACWVLDVAEERVLAEVAGPRPIALAPGRYVVKCAVDDARIDRAEVTLEGEVAVDALVFASEPLTYALAKGAAGGPLLRGVALTLAGGARVGSGGVPARGALIAGATLDVGAVAFPLQVVLQSEDDALVAHVLAGAGYRLPWWPVGRVDLGIELGAGTRAASFGQFLRWEVPLASRVSVLARVDLLTAWSPADEGAITLGALLSLGVSLPIFDGSGNQLSEMETSR